MPFGLKFKRTRRYEISTKNVFMVEVQMLDGSYLECTLTPDSVGRECLEAIAQKIELAEVQYFGLRYVTKKLQFRWADLDKPLKKQLEKHAQTSHASRSPRLYFGVLFYIPNAHKILDDVARYQYYLQLKNDIVDGRLTLNADQIIRLAAFSLQVEFGDFEYDRNAADYFTDNNVFPKNLCKDENLLSQLQLEVQSAYRNLTGVPPVKAEIQYMKDLQIVDGYGMEYYVAKDEKGKELYLGTSYMGVFARYLDGQTPIFFRWTEIARISQSKKTIEVDTSKSSAQYIMEDSDTSKYLRRMCLLQQKFFKSLKCSPRDVHQTVLPHNDIPDQLSESQTSLAYLQDQRYEQDSQPTSVSTEDYRQSQQSLNTSSHDIHQTHHVQHADGNHITQHHQQAPFHTQHQANDPTLNSNYARRLAALPAYRPTPSYESIMHQRMLQQQQQHQEQVQQTQTQASVDQYNQLQTVHHHYPHPMHHFSTQTQSIAQSQIYNHSGEGLAYSQPEIGHYGNHGGYYIDGTPLRTYNHAYQGVYHEQPELIPYRMGERQSNLVIQPTYSSPELNTQHMPQDYAADNFLHVNEAYSPYHFKPPPPYPRVSNSTPDLAVQTVRSTNITDSPDLVSRKTLGDSAFAAQSKLNKSLENLAEATLDPGERDSDRNALESLNTNDESTDPGDDNSSDHSNTTFHAKETDSEPEEGLTREAPQRQSKVLIRFVAPNKAPPPSTSKEVATQRESFRRMMIARSGSFTPGIMRTDFKRLSAQNRSLRIQNKRDSIQEQEVVDLSRTLNDISVSSQKDPLMLSLKPIENCTPGSVNKQIKDSDESEESKKLLVVHKKAISLDSSTERLQLLETLKSSDPPSKVSESMEPEDEPYIDDFHDSDREVPGIIPMGPLKVAAMNGLTMSRPMVLALMNDDSRAPKDERRKLLESKLSENLVFKEFEESPKKVPEMECSIGKTSENMQKNRFRDVIPYDSTRVKLTPRKDNSSGYINASHVKLSVGNRTWWYIATQAPLSNTTIDFWQMIWEQEVEVIAMLTPLVEMGKPKCFEYWPQESGFENKLTYGDYEVTLLFSNDSLCYITNRILMCHLPSKKERQVWHMQYTDWPDHGCPDDMYGFLGFLDEVESVQRLAESEEGSGKKTPIVVHCSAGVGRTGVVILTQVMKWCLEYNHDVDLPKALNTIRQQRMYMVQTLGQYNFIHKTLIQYLKNTRLI
ncbi:hypothetical protein CHS0354_007483 [Potamilus streckersoni]|uniref:protein-tyrosine-phosphatase n=1 Tax=Potamilus streckersoni TaxID=2493646 RepID=A0AAE0SVR9_9BIVA|nr:hypothetical protein CHS0354_007483 [Potamilus streckersoni]